MLYLGPFYQLFISKQIVADAQNKRLAWKIKVEQSFKSNRSGQGWDF